MSEGGLNAPSAIDVLRTQSLSLAAQEEIERMILAGELCAGDRVNENLLASKLGISRGPIREACRALIAAGLLYSHVNRGVFVRELSLTDALELYEIRARLEALACGLFAGRASESELTTLVELVAGMADAAERGDRTAYAPVNMEFHELIFARCGNQRLERLYKSLCKELSLFRRTSQNRPGALEAGVHEHHAIIAAIRTGEAERAEEAMREHVQRGGARLRAAVERNELRVVDPAEAPPPQADTNEYQANECQADECQGGYQPMSREEQA